MAATQGSEPQTDEETWDYEKVFSNLNLIEVLSRVLYHHTTNPGCKLVDQSPTSRNFIIHPNLPAGILPPENGLVEIQEALSVEVAADGSPGCIISDVHGHIPFVRFHAHTEYHPVPGSPDTQAKVTMLLSWRGDCPPLIRNLLRPYVRSSTVEFLDKVAADIRAP